MRPEPLALRDGDRDPVADVLAERPADLRTQRHHVTAGSGDHRPDVLELHLVDRHIDPYGLAGTEELGRVGNLDAAPGVALDLDADRCLEALPRCSHASTLLTCATHSSPAMRQEPSRSSPTPLPNPVHTRAARTIRGSACAALREAPARGKETG